MAFSTKFLRLMPSTIQESALVGFDNHGDPSYSTSATSYRCLINQKPTVVRNSMGEEVVAMYTAYVASTTPLPATSLYTFPNGDTPALQSVTVNYDEDGVHHNVLYFGGGQGG